MKSLSLQMRVINKLVKEKITTKELEIFKSKKENYKKMLEDQGSDFWIKFVITCKDCLYIDMPNDLYNTDVVFINFSIALKKGIDAVENFMKHLHEEYNQYCNDNVVMGGHDFLLHDEDASRELDAFVRVKCAMKISGTFVRLYNFWSKSKVGSDFMFQAPKYWLIPNSKRVGKLEEFLKSIYTIDEIPKVFECEEICWITEIIDLKDYASFSRTNPFAVMNTHKPGYTKRSQANSSAVVKLPEFQKTSLHWLPVPKSSKRQPNNKADVGMFQSLRDIRSINVNVRQWSLLEISIPPLLSQKFHCINVAKLMKGGMSDHHYMGTATWSTWYNESFGLQYFVKLHNLFKQIQKAKASNSQGRKLVEWQDTVDSMLMFINNLYDLDSAPIEEDNAKTAVEFILSPYILIQLPWNTVLLHQWLAASLVEVLLFEKNSLELRHWPFPANLSECAAKLLHAVKTLKERVVLGFAILSKQMISPNQTDVNHPSWIMDEIVLPSLPTLMFLISGKAYNILRGIKKIAWSKSQDLNTDWVYMPLNMYYMDSSIRKIYTNLCYCFPMWNKNKPKQSFSEEYTRTLDIEATIQKLKSTRMEFPSKNTECHIMKPLNNEENSVLEDIKATHCNTKHNIGNIQLLDTTLQVIKEEVIDRSRVPNVPYSSIEKIFSTQKMKKTASDIINQNLRNKNATLPHLAILSSIIYKECYTRLLGCEQENSVLARIVILSLEITERECIIRLTNFVSQYFKICPVTIKLDKSAPMKVAEMIKVLQDLVEDNRTRDWLWKQLPNEWKHPVSLTEPEPSLEYGTNTVVKMCEDRLGRIIFNVAQNCFNVYAQKRHIFPDWQMVQYVMPCYLASFVASVMSPKHLLGNFVGLKNLLKLIHGLIRSYEQSYTNWVTSKVETPEKTTKYALTQLIELLNPASYCRNLCLLYTSAYVGFDIPNGIVGNNHIMTPCLDWPYYVLGRELFTENMIPFIQPWIMKCIKFLNNLRSVCVQVWKPPLPGSQICHAPEFTEFYFTDAVMSIIECIFSYCSYYTNFIDENICDEVDDLRGQTPFTPWRLSFILFVNGDKDAMKSNLLALAHEELIRMTSLYVAMKKYMKKTGPVKLYCIDSYPSDSPELLIAMKHFSNCEFNQLDKMLPLLANNPELLIAQCPITGAGDSTSFTSKNCPKDVPNCKERYHLKMKKCRNCPKKEKKKDSFIVCEQCVEQNYPDINFYCSQECKQAWWKQEHMAQHLELELALGDFTYLSAK